MNQLSSLPLPPQELQILVGSHTPESFIDVGNAFINYFKQKNLLQKNYKVLEPGCGCGRIARNVVAELNSNSGGEYHGFDVHKKCIDWANENIKKAYPHSSFIHTDVYNCLYNPKGLIENVLDLKLPYEVNYFDFIYASSFFTHLSREHLEYYLRAIHNFCKSGGTIASTFFVYQDIDKFELVSEKELGIQSRYIKADNVSYFFSLDNPALVVTYHIDYLEGLMNAIGFDVLQSSLGWQSMWIFQKK